MARRFEPAYVDERCAESPAQPLHFCAMSAPPGTRILLAEDDDDLRELLTLRMEGAGHTVISARDGVEALALLDAAEPPAPRIIFTDWTMPRMDGLELARQIRADQGSRVPIILFTAHDVRDMVELADLDIHFLVKTTPWTEVERTIHDLLTGTSSTA